MNQYEESQLAQYEIDSALKDLRFAGEQNQELSKESRAIYDTYYDKLLLYSAGAFSFSVTLVSLVVNNKSGTLSKVGLLIPNVFWMYGAMVLYLLTCLFVLLARRFDAAYAGAFGMKNYTEKKKRHEEAMLQFMQTHKDRVLVTKGGTPEGEIASHQGNIAKLEGAIEKNTQITNWNYRLKCACHIAAEITALCATVLLFLFTVQLVQAMVWG